MAEQTNHPVFSQFSVKAADLTLAEQASLTSGGTFWHTKPISRVGLPAIMVSDGPHGLRKQPGTGDHLGVGQSVPATCFPPAAGLASSWDTDLLKRVGIALGHEAAIENVGVVLGPGINIKRSPLCGRNFEYFSEDPLVAGYLGAAMVQGIQSQGVGTSLKHFAANNQENERMRVSADIDPRPLREIYLRGFEKVVKTAQPWTVMCSYNKVNGEYASENKWLLTDVLRKEWGFEGLVISDWGAVNDRVKGLPAGLDLEMPTSGGRNDQLLVDAVRDGRLPAEKLEIAADRVLDLVRKATAISGEDQGTLDVDGHHALAKEAAGRSIVLLKNENDILPLNPTSNIAVIGAFAETPRYQGAGSSKINPTRLDAALPFIQNMASGNITYSPGFSLDGVSEAGLREAAIDAAKSAEVAVLFLGLPPEYESEGFDRTNMDLPSDQLELLDAVLGVNPNVVVVLSNGSVVALPFADRVPAIVEAWLLGQAGGAATADMLFGVINPSGKLTETIPLRLADNPAYLDGDGDDLHVRYGEGIFVGYRWYDGRELEVTYPFGHGLSYTTFEYGEASVSTSANGIEVRVPITNKGTRDGREVTQVYVSLPGSTLHRAPRELKAFTSVQVRAGETCEAVMNIPRGDLAYWNVRTDSWIVEGGDYLVEVGASSRDLRTFATVAIDGDAVKIPLTMQSSMGELLANPVAAEALGNVTKRGIGGPDVDDIMPAEAVAAMMSSMPVNRISMLAGPDLDPAVIEEVISKVNAADNK